MATEGIKNLKGTGIIEGFQKGITDQTGNLPQMQ
jgi:hypothetical protein